MDILPYPPAPEFGWYAEDTQPVQTYPAATPQDAVQSDHAAEPISPTTDQPSATPQDAVQPSEQPAMHDNGDIEDWDSTVLSTAFTSKAPHRTWTLHNEITGQTIIIDKSTLLGRKPSMDVPEGAKAERILDPTRTTSRNHAAISIDQNGELWVEDYGSLNGTFIIRDGQETQVKDKPFQLEAPATLRIGDQFFKLTEDQG